MDDQFNKADGGKHDPRLLEVGCTHALRAVTAVLMYGAQKYAADSWKDVEPVRYDSAARRHRIERDLGNKYDDESGLMHLAHEATCILFQLEAAIATGKMKNYLHFNKPPLDHRRTGNE